MSAYEGAWGFVLGFVLGLDVAIEGSLLENGPGRL